MIYEINFHTTHATDPPEDVRNKVVAGQGGGISLSYTMLTYLKYLGIKDQTAFSSWQYSYRYNTNPSEYVKLWGMLRDLDRTKNKRPTWLSVEIANKAIFGDMTRTVHSYDEAKWVQLPINGISQQMNVSYVHSFAFKNEKNGSLILYNLHRTLDQVVRLDVETNPGSAAKKYVLASPDIYDHNEGKAENVSIARYDLDDFTFNYSLTLPPHSITVLTWKGNVPPVANFSYDPVTPDVDEKVLFRSTFSDSDGTVVNWTWDFGDGSQNIYGPNVTHRYADNGNYTVNMRVRDDGGTTISVAKNITVKNSPPVCHTMEDIEDYEERYLLFTGYGNDTPSDRYSLLYRWDFGDGNSTDWENNAIAGHAYPEKGTYEATLFVMDDEGLQAYEFMNVTILNHPPMAQIDPLLNNTTINEDEIFRFDGTGDDSPSDINSLMYRWKFGDGNISNWAVDAEINHSYTLSSEYDVVFQVRDNNNDTANASMNIKIVNVAPSGGFTPKKMLYVEDERIVIEVEDIYDTPSDLPSLKVVWLADNVAVGSGRNVSFSIPLAGPVIISMNLTDDDGASFNSSQRFIIRNIAPQAHFSASAQIISADQVIEFDAGNTSDTPSDLDSLNYTWTFVDGSKAYGDYLEHRFLKEGIFSIELKVTDDDGESDTYEMVITVGNINTDEGDWTADKGMGKNTWFLILFITVVVLILIVGIGLFQYYKKREERSATGKIEKTEEEVVEEKSGKTELPEEIAVVVKEEYKRRKKVKKMKGVSEVDEMPTEEAELIEKVDEMLTGEEDWIEYEADTFVGETGWIEDEKETHAEEEGLIEEVDEMFTKGEGWIEDVDEIPEEEGEWIEDEEEMDDWTGEGESFDMEDGWIEDEEDEILTGEGWIEEVEEYIEEWDKVIEDEPEEIEEWGEMLEDEPEEIEEWGEVDYEKEYDNVWVEEEWVDDSELEDWF